MLSWVIPKRWEMCLMLSFASVVAYTMRVNMSVAALAMKKDLGWTDSQKGLALSAFYWGYAGGQILAAPLVQKVGAKYALGFSILLSAVCSLFIPVAWQHSFGLGLFVRVMTGLAESFFFPAIYHFIPAWIPLEEKTLMVPIIYAGSYVGNIIGFSVAGSIVDTSITIGGKEYGVWYGVFYVFALLGFAFFPYWMIMAYEKPADHPSISADELEFINAGKHYASDAKDEPDRYEMPEDSSKAASVSMLEMNERRSDEMVRPTADVQTNANHMAVATVGDDATAHEDDEAEYTYPIAIEHMAFNMLATGSSRTARLHGHSAKPTGRPRKISIVSEHKIREEMAAHTPWREFFTHPVALTLYFNSWVNGWIGFTLMSEMPPYLYSLGFSVSQAGTLSVYPYIALFLTTLMYGAFFENMHVHFGWPTDRVRRVAETVSFLGSGVFLIICGFMDEKYTSYAFLIVTQSFYGAVQSGVQCSYSDVAPNYSSALNTVGNCISAVAGIAGPLIVSALTEGLPVRWGWRVAFFLTFGQGVLGLALWYTFQTSEIVPALNNPTSEHHTKRIQSLVPQKGSVASQKKVDNRV